MTRPVQPRRAARVTTALVGLALVATACSGDDDADREARVTPTTTTSSPSTPSATPTPTPPPAPKVGSCHALSWNDALAPTAANAGGSCTKSTSLTFHVGTLGKNKDGTQLQVDSAEAQRRIAKACPRELREFLGGTSEQRRLSLLTTIWFTPTLEEEAQGARWYRCDLVAPIAGEKLMRVGRGMRNSMGTDAVAKYALCAVGKPGSGTFSHLPCKKKHSWRAVRTVDIAGDKHPGRNAVAELMTEPCTDAATELAADKRDVRWGQEGPTKKQWKAGQRYGVCWAPA